ncbi:zinc finger protein, putative [Plasmodium knowlesi strain H]|uniref:Zinc finger protein, putative n=3 Tax=Plasmodium knowlesi TaxID=5850 RepID=A0A5K1UJC7_PLAKH|nr:uncharacterized protein PKNH_1462400 [Plasmodium knowlesi strain H]OTN63995.1 putative Zinc finger protein [Plasmodium knowlesi]CAA9991221.1 zinc finger protein, putative [Plasmodium knowlesi strain H]SBO26288.1 zinc finger protein, putative [Plasmodium knowlesi strain H]SBO29578.1 zinc finger protein, putative [Plasmodium knowlesi strain H]VVS80695.1 zinc finger protein, putative [Plasmodium knowlesi strain H]|eukprot:XP_002262503.1 [Plasmodium knowlesi strain H]
MNNRRRGSGVPYEDRNKEPGDNSSSRHTHSDTKHDRNDVKEKKSQASIDNFGRKIWDKDYYKKKAEEKTTNEEDDLILKLLPDLKKKKVPSPPPPSERKLLEGRKEILTLEKNLGKVQIITEKTIKQEQGGYYCKICDCVLKDSQTYLDHINGKNHNRMLGYSMKVKRVALSDVVNKLNVLRDAKRKKSQEDDVAVDIDPEKNVKKRVLDFQQMEEMKAQRRKEKKLLKKLEKQRRDEHENDQREDEQEDDENAQLRKMGLPTSFA